MLDPLAAREITQETVNWLPRFSNSRVPSTKDEYVNFGLNQSPENNLFTVFS